MKSILITVTSLMLMSFVINKGINFKIEGEAKNKKYAYSINDPIRVGGGASAGHHFQFLEHLRGPNGEKLEVIRIVSCGNYDNPDPELTKFERGVLTCFSINCSAFKKPRILYFDKYRNGALYTPKGLTWEE